MPIEAPVGSVSSLALVVSYLDVPRSLRPPLWREFTPTPATRRRSASTHVVASPPRTVVLVPGFLAPDETTTALRAAIGGAGHRTHRARLASMNGCSEVLASKLRPLDIGVHVSASEWCTATW